MLKHKNWLVLVLLVLFLSACSKEKEKTAKVLKEQPTNLMLLNRAEFYDRNKTRVDF